MISIGFGEDGPTYQPIEHPRPCAPCRTCACSAPADAVETAECWKPSRSSWARGTHALALTRQALSQVRKHAGEGTCARGYEISPAEGKEGEHLRLRLGGRDRARGAEALFERGMTARVVSVPSLDLLLAQPEPIRREIVGEAPVKVAIEAAVRRWDVYSTGFVGMKGFGASAPYKDLYKHFGITARPSPTSAAHA